MIYYIINNLNIVNILLAFIGGTFVAIATSFHEYYKERTCCC